MAQTKREKTHDCPLEHSRERCDQTSLGQLTGIRTTNRKKAVASRQAGNSVEMRLSSQLRCGEYLSSSACCSRGVGYGALDFAFWPITSAGALQRDVRSRG